MERAKVVQGHGGATTAAGRALTATATQGRRWRAPRPLTPLCQATFVAMLRMRAGMDMAGLAQGASATRPGSREHVMTCSSADLYQMRHNLLLLAMIRLVRSTGATVRPEPLLRRRPEGGPHGPAGH